MTYAIVDYYLCERSLEKKLMNSVRNVFIYLFVFSRLLSIQPIDYSCIVQSLSVPSRYLRTYLPGPSPYYAG